MWEENQSIDMQRKWVAWSPYKSRLREIAENRKQVKQTAEDDTFNHLSASAMELDNQAYQTSDENLNKEYKKNSQLAAVSYMVKYAAKQNWADWSNLTTVSDIMSNYFNKFPETAPQIKEFINSDRDPEEFWIEMWWIENDRDEETLNWLERVWRDLKKPADMLVQWAWDLWWYLSRKENPWWADVQAIDDFALRKYWKVIENMTEDEIARLELDLDLERAKNWSYIMWNWENSVWWEYVPWKDRQRLDVAGAEIWLWLPLEVLEAWYALPSLWLAARWETPYVNFPIQLFWEWGRMIWNLVSMIPWVDWWIASLPEDVQEDVKSIWWMLVLWKMIGKWTVKDWQVRPRLKNTINKITANDIIWWIMDFISKYWDKIKDSNLYNKLSDINNNPWELWNWILDITKNWWKWTAETANNLWNSVKSFAKSSEYKKLEKEWKQEDRKMDVAWKVSWSTNKTTAIEETEIAKRALEDLIDADIDLSKIKTEDELLDAFWWNSDKIAAFEDGIYSMDKRRWKKSQTRSVVTNVDEFWISDSYLSDTIGRWFKVLKEIYKDSPQIESQLRILEKRWEQKWLNRQEVNAMAKMIAEWAKIYKNTTRDVFTAEYIKEIEWTRRALKEWARSVYKDTVPQLYNALEILDNIWSDSMNMEAMINRNLWELRAYKNWWPLQEARQEMWSTTKRTIYSKWRNLLDAFLKDTRYNPLKRSADLNNNLTEFQKSDSKVNRWNYQKLVKEWYEETFRDIVDPEGTYYNIWEWEVISPKKRNYRDINNYLEDIVEIVEEKELTPEEYLKLDNQLKKLWLSDEQIESAKQATKIYQESLFWDEFGSKPVADIEEWVIKKNNKSKK